MDMFVLILTCIPLFIIAWLSGRAFARSITRKHQNIIDMDNNSKIVRDQYYTKTIDVYPELAPTFDIFGDGIPELPCEELFHEWKYSTINIRLLTLPESCECVGITHPIVEHQYSHYCNCVDCLKRRHETRDPTYLEMNGYFDV